MHTVSEAAERAAELGWPVVLKPVISRRYRPERGTVDKFGVQYANDPDELASRLAPLEGKTAVLLQEYLHGKGSGIELLAVNGRPLAVFQHERLAEVPLTGGASAWRRSAALDPQLCEPAVRLVEALNWTGLIMVEFKVGADVHLMEINGRAWGSLPLACHAGMDFPVRWARLVFDGPPAAQAGPDTEYVVGRKAYNFELLCVWIVNVLLGRRRYRYLRVPPRSSVLGALWSLVDPAQRSDSFAWDDPRPALSELVKIARKLTSKASGTTRGGDHG